jgi:hypothetical protein
MEKVVNASQAAKHDLHKMWKYVREAEACYTYEFNNNRTKGKTSTLYYLSQYLDQEKFKKK